MQANFKSWLAATVHRFFEYVRHQHVSGRRPTATCKMNALARRGDPVEYLRTPRNAGSHRRAALLERGLNLLDEAHVDHLIVAHVLL